MSTTVIAYPEPRYNLEYKNGTANNMMTVNLYKNAINNFTIYCEQQLVEEMNSVTYTLKLSNVLGASTVFISIRKQGKRLYFSTILYTFVFIFVAYTLKYDNTIYIEIELML